MSIKHTTTTMETAALLDENPSTVLEVLEPIKRLRRDIRTAISTVSIPEARYLVDAYYAVQNYRKAAQEQVRSLTKSEEPHEVISWLFSQQEVIEAEVKKALDKWTDTDPLSMWSKSIDGIGPIISAGLLAHIDISKCPSAGHIWSFAGMYPTVDKESGQVLGSVRWMPKTKRPWNAKLKVVFYHAGECFVRVQGRETDYYGKIFRQRKDQEISRNDAGRFSDQAKYKVGLLTDKTTEAYQWYSGRYPAGASSIIQPMNTEQRKEYLDRVKGEPGSGLHMLPPAHIHARARRYTVRIFSSHYHWVGYRYLHGIDPPEPYVIGHMKHVDLMRPPNFPW